MFSCNVFSVVIISLLFAFCCVGVHICCRETGDEIKEIEAVGEIGFGNPGK